MLGSRRRLSEYLHGRLERALDDLARLDPDELLAENAEVVVVALLDKHMPTEIAVEWDQPTRSPVAEVSTEVRDQFDRDEIYTVPASKLVVSFPVSGTTEMLDYQASAFSFSGEYGQMSSGHIVVEIVERTLNADVIRERIERVKESIDRRVGWANADLAQFRPTAEQALRSAYTSRKDRILNDRMVEDALGIPVCTSSAPRQPVDARRKQVTLKKRQEQSTFVPEPELGEAIYQDVLGVVRSWATSLERTPSTAAKLHEEEIRDLLLGTLNGYWRGAAGGELFNGSGKTDILIREGDRNAFIAECKMWRGPKGITDALNQLLSYLVWRDSKAALVVFINTADPTATVEKLHTAVEGHPRHVLTKEAGNPRSRVEYIFTADTEGRRVALAVVPVVIAAKS